MLSPRMRPTRWRHGNDDPRYDDLQLDLLWWRRLPAWSLAEAICALSGDQPGAAVPLIVKDGVAPLDRASLHFPHVADVLSRGVAANLVADPAPPAKWIRVARGAGLPIPAALGGKKRPAVPPASIADIREAIRAASGPPRPSQDEVERRVRAALPGKSVSQKLFRELDADVCGPRRRGRPAFRNRPAQ